MRESEYQRRVIKKLEDRFPGCVVIKNDSSYIQGIPDLLVLFGNRWAMLEVKANSTASFEPNQEYYLDRFDSMSFGAVICPEYEEDVLSALQRSFEDCGASRHA